MIGGGSICSIEGTGNSSIVVSSKNILKSDFKNVSCLLSRTYRIQRNYVLFGFHHLAKNT